MTFLVLAGLLYFLPSIIGHNKRNAAGIFLLNFFLGWTFVGWIMALIWACTADVRIPIVAVATPVPANYCARCGNIKFPSAQFCSVCGRPY
ncbi:MAG TPA: superinfection immunity protein [Candidatus Acidoferrales bacterium]|nr:superinfection immunity protein [Candidatus Acidoferrales bacterium]